MSRSKQLEALLSERIAILDGEGTDAVAWYRALGGEPDAKA